MAIHHLSLGQSLQKAIEKHETILLAPGRHRGGIRIAKSIKIIGEIGAIIDGNGSNSSISVVEDGIDVSISGLSIEKGNADFGGGLLIEAYAVVTIESCRFKNNHAGSGGGAGMGILYGEVHLKDCRFESKQEAFISNIGEAHFENCALLGGLSGYEGAQITTHGGEVQGGLNLKGTTSHSPSLIIEGTEIDHIENHEHYPAKIMRF